MIINPRTRMSGLQGDPVEVWERSAHSSHPPGSNTSLQSEVIRRENLLGSERSIRSDQIPGSAGSLIPRSSELLPGSSREMHIPGSAGSVIPGSREVLGPPGSGDRIAMPGSIESIRGQIPGSHNSYHSAYSTLRRDGVVPTSNTSLIGSAPLAPGGVGDTIPTASSLSSSHSHNVYASPAPSRPQTGDLGAGYPGTASSTSSHLQRPGSDSVRYQWDADRIAKYLLPHTQYAHCGEDINLLARVLELSRVSEADNETTKLLLRALKFLRLCDYSVEDICSTLAHASAYFVDAFSLCGNAMDSCEVGNVLTTLMFIAHCYVQDETCPLHVWHQHLFKAYCPLRTLNVAILRLMEIRRYMLRLNQEDFDRRYFSLLQAAQRRANYDLSANAASTSASSPPASSGALASGGANEEVGRHVDVELRANQGTRSTPTSSTSLAGVAASSPGEGADAMLSKLLVNFRNQTPK